MILIYLIKNSRLEGTLGSLSSVTCFCRQPCHIIFFICRSGSAYNQLEFFGLGVGVFLVFLLLVLLVESRHIFSFLLELEMF